MKADQFDPEMLDAALVVLIDRAQTARDCFLMGEEDAGLKAFELAIVAISKATHQISLLHHK
jgi:hypothetical protein